MAFRAIRNSRSTRWTQKLGIIFQEHDTNKTGTISVEQMSDIYRFYKVELNLDDVKILSINGQIKKTDFIEYALETKLLDLTDTSNTRRTLTDNTQDKSKPGRRKSIDVAQKLKMFQKQKQNQSGLLCCFGKKKSKSLKPDRIEAAFRRLDLNNDGVLDWEEFKKGTKDLDEDTAKRIFKNCDQNEDQKISLEEFRNMANLKNK